MSYLEESTAQLSLALAGQSQRRIYLILLAVSGVTARARPAWPTEMLIWGPAEGSHRSGVPGSWTDWSLLPLVLAVPNPFPLQLGRGSEHSCSHWWVLPGCQPSWQLTCSPHWDIPAVTHAHHPTHQQRWGQENKSIAAQQLLRTLLATPLGSPGHGAAWQQPAGPLSCTSSTGYRIALICYTGSPPHILSGMLPLPLDR